MKRICIAWLALSLTVVLSLPASAEQVSLDNALILTFDDDGDRSQQVFKDNRYYAVQAGEAIFTAESGGKCTVFIPEENLQMSEKCSEFAAKTRESVKNMRERMGMTEEQMAAMKKFGGGGEPEPLRETGTETIANFEATCFANSERKVCVSGPVAKKVKAEGFDSRELATNMTESDMGLGGDDQQNKQLLEIYQRGYPVLDMETAAKPSIPGWDFLDDATRKQILAQMGDAAGGGGSGSKLISVDRKSISFELPQLEEVTIDQMMTRMMDKNF